MITEALNLLLSGKDLSETQSEELMHFIMEGRATDAQIGALLGLLARKGPAPGEVAGFVKAMRSKAVQVPHEGDVMDLCGTGGDGAGTVNISTACSFVVAACGVPVAKHGNRAATSKSGGADVLQAVGLRLEAPPQRLAEALRELGICFLFARTIHPAMRHVAKARSELGFRTIFNVLGPLTNPLGPSWQLIGVYAPHVAEIMAQALLSIGCKRAWLVHGAEGLDEVSPSGPTEVWEVAGGRVRSFRVEPADFGFEPEPLQGIRGGDPTYNAKVLRETLAGRESPALRTTLMNAACALVVAGKASGLKEGVTLAREAVADGRAAELLEGLVQFMGR